MTRRLALKFSDWRERNRDPLSANWNPTLPLDVWALLAVFAAAVALRIFALGAESLWFDETYSVMLAEKPLSWGMVTLPGGVYLALLHFWLALGRSEIAIRLLSAAFGIATVPVVFVLARRLFGWRPALWAAGLVAISPFHVWYSREARMYALAGFFAWLAVWAAVEALRHRKPWLWLVYWLGAAFGLYTHSFSVFVMLAVNLWVLLVFVLEPDKRRAIVPWLTANLMFVALAVPWLIAFSQQQSLGWWGWVGQKYGAPGLAQLLRLPADFALGTTRPDWGPLGWVPLLAWAAVFIWGLIPLSRGKEPSWWRAGGREWACGIILAAVPILTMFVASHVVPMFVVRYTFVFMPAFAIIAGRGFGKLKPSIARWGVAALYLAGVAATLVTMFTIPQKEDFRGAMVYLAGEAPANAIVFLVDEDIKVPVEHYYKKPADFHPIWRGHTSDADLSPRVDPFVQQAQEFWLVVSHTDNDAVELYLSRFGDVVGRQQFLGVSVLRFLRKEGGG